jgi:hypothetical protein
MTERKIRMDAKKAVAFDKFVHGGLRVDRHSLPWLVAALFLCLIIKELS